jgi:hypothetical protein
MAHKLAMVGYLILMPPENRFFIFRYRQDAANGGQTCHGWLSHPDAQLLWTETGRGLSTFIYTQTHISQLLNFVTMEHLDYSNFSAKIKGIINYPMENVANYIVITFYFSFSPC